ncbi:MAG: DNA polymerase I [Duncaniella sp.]|uniref:DNA polymerase I n=1 Tax=Duncaniella sp. TaxID=2518496 RepID=UPI0023CF9A4C|nr:DNA polymerase I [Duncaniella sp.]MDE5989885.1 DNA polymerase I [Duncaniella sp.]
MEKRLFLLDAYALIYRAYYALIRSPRFTGNGFNTSAVFGFCNTLDELLRKENPSHVAVCFDPSGPTFRHEEFADYKANRDKQPEDITASVPYIKRILEAYQIPVIEVKGYEADDVIGTLAKRAAAEGYDTYMMTPDKDYGQLVDDHIFMYRPALRGEGFEIRDTAKICERYGISRPSQVIDLLALEGDASDNIPGCPGVGEKTARTLIETWGSVENLLENTDSLKGALQKKVRENAEKIRLSKYLATIKTDVPVEIEIDSLIRKPMDADKLLDVYNELEFRTLAARLKAGSKSRQETSAPQADISAPQTPAPAADDSGMGSLFDLPEENSGPETLPQACEDRDYRLLTSPAEVAETVNRIASSQFIGASFYAVGEEAMTARWDGLALAVKDCEGWFIDLSGDNQERRREILAAIEPLFTGQATLVSHDVKRGYLLLKNEGINLTAPYFDTSVAHYLIDPEMKHELRYVVSKYLRMELSGVDPDMKPGHPKTPLTTEAAMARYCEEADLALRLRAPLNEEVALREMSGLLTDVEFPLIRVLAEMEFTGVRIDASVLTDLSARLKERIRGLEEEAYEMAGGPFNIGSPAQVGMVLFERLNIDPKAKKTARGSYSTTEQILEKYAAKVPLVSLILKIRRLKKLVTTYLDALPALVNPKTGKIHTSYNQTVTATGRISSTNPNLQNIPVRTDEGREIRRAFIADPGDSMMSADYSQIELRLIADLSADRDMIEGFLSGDDIHRITASKIYGVPLEEVTEDERRRAKTANFGIIYGISAFGLSERLGIARAEAKKLIDGYFATYPHIRDYLTKSVETAREQGYVSTRMGRRRYLPDINSRNAVVRGYAERNAVNAPIQGSAADIIKVAMVSIFNEMEARGLRSRMLMQVHDELIFNIVPGEADEMHRLVVSCMENAYHGAVPLTVSAGVAGNWLEAH